MNELFELILEAEKKDLNRSVYSVAFPSGNDLANTLACAEWVVVSEDERLKDLIIQNETSLKDLIEMTGDDPEEFLGAVKTVIRNGKTELPERFASTYKFDLLLVENYDYFNQGEKTEKFSVFGLIY